jgi:hypothetical protein
MDHYNWMRDETRKDEVSVVEIAEDKYSVNV